MCFVKCNNFEKLASLFLQLAHDISIIQEGFKGFAKLSHSLTIRAETTKVLAEISEELGR